MQEGPSISTMDNAVVQTSNVTSEIPNHHCIDTYTMKEEDLEVKTQPFVHPVKLRGEKGVSTSVDRLFDEGALVNSICKTVYPTLQNVLGALTPSLKTL